MPPAVRPAVDYQAVLAQTSIFAGCGRRELGALLSLAVKKRYPARAVVLKKGDAALQLFVIARGRLKAISEGGAGQQAALSIMGPGEVFGEVALFDGEPRSATITAIEPCEILSLGRNDFVSFLERTPKVAIRLVEVLARRLRRLSERLEDTTFLPLDARLARELLRLAARYGASTARGRRIDLRLSQAEIGQLCGASRESVNKQLRAWEAAGIIARQAGRIVICDERALGEVGDAE